MRNNPSCRLSYQSSILGNLAIVLPVPGVSAMTRAAVIPWSADDTAEALRDRYRAEPEGVVRTRLHALWLLRQPEAGWTPTTVAAALGVHRGTVQQWLRWYREGGLTQVCGRRKGGPGKPRFLTPAQERQVVAEAATGVFATAQAVRD